MAWNVEKGRAGCQDNRVGLINHTTHPHLAGADQRGLSHYQPVARQLARGGGYAAR